MYSFSSTIVIVFAIHATLLCGNARAESSTIVATYDPVTGCATLSEIDQSILTYNYHIVDAPNGVLASLHPESRKFAQSRSNYIHPLYDLDGQVLTDDWPRADPHHRGIYWAWPEVGYKGMQGNLHALQRVFARPTGTIEVRSKKNFGEIKAENVWKWDDKTDIVREVATIRAYSREQGGRYVDLTLSFVALHDDVSIARQELEKYGGMNFRQSPVHDIEIVKHMDPVGANPRRSWADSIGVRDAGTKHLSGIAIFEKRTNPQYPGQWVDYPDLPWLQPTFPTAGTRFILKKNNPLVLEYRLWIRRGGKLKEAEYDRHWRTYQRNDYQ